MKRFFSLAALFALLFSLPGCKSHRKEEAAVPRIINIVNFIRLLEPRYEEVTQDVLYETVVKQLELMNGYGFRGTFLLQYDALMEQRYQALLRDSGHETGGWWEITQPHAEKAGLAWRGRYPWDWHADVGFATGYTPQEREKLVDVYMEDFKTVFGVYPKTVGSWFIDAHTLRYMHEKYGLEASCNMKDQVGTDGYTLWGGYWAGAYYPSRRNAYMPAQHEAMQIPVPVFRMLGSDPIYQYDNGLGASVQKVESLEPVYPESGGNPQWIRYFFGSLVNDPALGYTYAQTGQENSFTWAAMERGLREQFRVIDSLRTSDAVRIEPLAETARWFRESYPLTPPTALSVMEDYKHEGRQTIWFNSRFYRANLLLEHGGLRLRDVHLFDEMLMSDYFAARGTTHECVYRTLPVMDGFGWSTDDARAGLYFCTIDKEGFPVPAVVKKISRIVSADGKNITAVCKTGKGNITIRFEESGWAVGFSRDSREWGVAFLFGSEKKILLPDMAVLPDRVEMLLNGHPYTLEAQMGKFSMLDKTSDGPLHSAWILRPENGNIAVNCSRR